MGIVNSATLKIRGGVERDVYGKKAGKGPLVQWDMSATLGVSQDQTLFVWTDDEETKAICYGVCSYDSNAMRSKNPHSGFYEADTARTIDMNGGNPACYQGGVCVVELHGEEGL